jgi:hypothetical protein
MRFQCSENVLKKPVSSKLSFLSGKKLDVPKDLRMNTLLDIMSGITKAQERIRSEVLSNGEVVRTRGSSRRVSAGGSSTASRSSQVSRMRSKSSLDCSASGCDSEVEAVDINIKQHQHQAVDSEFENIDIDIKQHQATSSEHQATSTSETSTSSIARKRLCRKTPQSKTSQSEDTLSCKRQKTQTEPANDPVPEPPGEKIKAKKTGKQECKPLLEKRAACDYAKELMKDKNFRGSVEGAVAKRFPHLLLNEKQKVKSGLLGRWLGAYEKYSWGDIQENDLAKHQKLTAKIPPIWLQPHLGAGRQGTDEACPQSVDNAKASGQAAPKEDLDASGSKNQGNPNNAKTPKLGNQRYNKKVLKYFSKEHFEVYKLCSLLSWAEE